MTPSARNLTAAASLGSALLLAGAFLFQWLGYAPCKMCLWQRYPHAAAIAIGLIALAIPHPRLALLGALAALTTASIGGFHMGVEQGWWDGPSSCSGGDIGALSPQDLMDQIMAAPLVRCDDIAWSLAGISMAGWNMLASLALTAIWLFAAKAGSAGGRL